MDRQTDRREHNRILQLRLKGTQKLHNWHKHICVSEMVARYSYAVFCLWLQIYLKKQLQCDIFKSQLGTLPSGTETDAKQPFTQ